MDVPVGMRGRFWANHHLLDLVQRPLWRVVKGRSRTYVQKILAGVPHLCMRKIPLLLAIQLLSCQQPGPVLFPIPQLLAALTHVGTVPCPGCM